MQSGRVPRLPGPCPLQHVASKITLQLTYQEKSMRVIHGSLHNTRPGSGVRRFSTHVALAAT